jgi:hypothetical protein
MATLQRSLAALEAQIAEWNTTQRLAREQHYFLNYFTMREILQVTKLLDSAAMAKIHRFGTAAAFQEVMNGSLGGGIQLGGGRATAAATVAEGGVVADGDTAAHGTGTATASPAVDPDQLELFLTILPDAGETKATAFIE